MTIDFDAICMNQYGVSSSFKHRDRFKFCVNVKN